ncbi:phosphate ABC transporter permease subunit PstC [Proteiniborus sp.]|uniref:phosphate ABC transporter permease subunit PstC n=1 Tax=Proteiniborus sp. TaxID=2079015 RepID=UPI003332EB71
MKSSEKLIEIFFFVCALFAVLSVAIITIYIFAKGIPAIITIGLGDFVLGTVWKPMQDIFGIFPMIIGSILATIGAIVIGVPIGVLTAVFLAEIAPRRIAKIVQPAVELLAGIPSVVYGFFGLVVIVPMISNYLGGPGNSLLAVNIMLGIMILPTIVNISVTSIRAVPSEYKEASLGIGASHIQTIFKVILPAARSGILTGIVLGIGRAIGETMAVILVAGNTPAVPGSILAPIRTLTANIAMEMSYAFGLHQDALFATGVILFAFIMILNIVLSKMTSKVGD